MAKLKDLLPQIPKDELAILRDLNSKLDESKLTEVTAKEAAQAVNTIIKGWKNWSKYTLAAMLLVPNISNALETYSPDTLNAIKTEISATDNVKTDSTAVKAISNSVPGAIKTVNFSENFASGKVELTNRDALAKQMGELQTFLKGKDPSKFRVVIVAGESQVTNPKGFETKGSLAQARAEAVKNEIKGLKFSNIDIQTEIGTTAYKPGNNVNDPKYQAEQFVTISIIANNDICSMPDVDRNEGQGVASNNYVTYDDYISGVGELVLDTGTIPDRMVVLDANGNIKQDTGYITTKTSKYKDWKYTPAHVLALTKAYIAGNVSMKGIDPKTVITVTDYDDLVKQISNTAKPGTIGDEIGPALREMNKMIQKGQKEFVIYNLGNSVAKLKFDQNKGEVQAKVYSPVGKTGYNIKGSCKR
jgi:hypothetical protein